MRKTAWSAQSSSSFPSDRLAPRNPPPSKKKSNTQSPSSSPSSQPKKPLSPALAKLDDLITTLARASLADPDPKGGCFCQTRSAGTSAPAHPLSPYTPLCMECGLVVCAQNRLGFSCPHCVYPLLSVPQKSALVERLGRERVETEEREEEEARVREEERRRAVGAFPTLSGAPTATGSSASSSPLPTTHKVLSLTGSGTSTKSKGKNKKVVLSTITTAPSTPTDPNTRRNRDIGATTGAVQVPDTRVPPPVGVVPAQASSRDPRRPFRNLRQPVEWYVHPPQVRAVRVDDGAEGDGKGKRRRRRGKGKGRVDGDGDGGGEGDGEEGEEGEGVGPGES